MFRIVCLAASVLLCGCTCSGSDSSSQNGAAVVKRPSAKVPGARTAGPGKGGKSKSKAKAKGPPNANKRKGTAPVGVKGELKGAMTLAEVPGRAEGSVATEASLELRWEGDKAEVNLGSVPTTCEQVAPSPIGPSGKEVTPLWSVRCEGKKGAATLAVMQQGPSLQVRRSMTIEGGKASPYKLVKRVQLVEGATIVRVDGFE